MAPPCATYIVSLSKTLVCAQGRYRLQYKRPLIILQAITPCKNKQSGTLATRDYVPPTSPSRHRFYHMDT